MSSSFLSAVEAAAARRVLGLHVASEWTVMAVVPTGATFTVRARKGDRVLVQQNVSAESLAAFDPQASWGGLRKPNVISFDNIISGGKL